MYILLNCTPFTCKGALQVHVTNTHTQMCDILQQILGMQQRFWGGVNLVESTTGVDVYIGANHLGLPLESVEGARHCRSVIHLLLQQMSEMGQTPISVIIFKGCLAQRQLRGVRWAWVSSPLTVRAAGCILGSARKPSGGDWPSFPQVAGLVTFPSPFQPELPCDPVVYSSLVGLHSEYNILVWAPCYS